MQAQSIADIQSGHLAIEGLTKYFSVQGNQVQALDDIRLEIRKGEFISIIGGSGCGKSTLLRIIAGLDTDYEGKVLLDGKPVTGAGDERGIVFQEPRLFPWLNVEENIGFGISGNSAGRRNKIQSHVKLIGLQGFEKAYPAQLSGGMAQRVSIARAIVNRPEVLLLDEPFGALDAFTKIHLHDEVLKIWEFEGSTMILVTHDIDEAIYLSDRVVVMSNRPGSVRKVFDVPLPRPRDRNRLDFINIRRAVYKEFFTQAEETFVYTI